MTVLRQLDDSTRRGLAGYNILRLTYTIFFKEELMDMEFASKGVGTAGNLRTEVVKRGKQRSNRKRARSVP